jgi:hypothetical protein
MWVLPSTTDKEVFGAPFYRPSPHTPDRILRRQFAQAEGQPSGWGTVPIGSSPRKRKRRPKHYPLLAQPRAEAQAALTPKG